MAGQNGNEERCRVLLIAFLCVVGAAIVVGAAFLAIKIECEDINEPSGPEYSISITGVAGLDVDDVAGDLHPTLSPVFNLTLRVNNTRDKEYQACVPLASTASVSYGDAFLGKGSVPPFCAEANREREEQVRAWGQGVAVPRFLRDQLAGEIRRGDAAVDVTVRMPSGCNMISCYDTVLLCRAKIRGAPTCLMAASVVPISTKT